MRTKLLLLAVFFAPLFANAQTSEGNKVQLGFTTSPIFGWLTIPSGQTPEIKPNGMRTGFAYGVLADIPFSDNYYFSTALTVSTLNAKTTQPGINTAIYKLQYLELPLTLKLKSDEVNNRKFYGQFGLNTGINIGSKQDIMYSNSTTPDEKGKDVSKLINTFRAGLLLGGGAEWKVGENMSVLTGLSYSNGFSDVFDGEAKAKNSYIALNLGIFF